LPKDLAIPGKIGDNWGTGPVAIVLLPLSQLFFHRCRRVHKFRLAPVTAGEKPKTVTEESRFTHNAFVFIWLFCEIAPKGQAC
jgi:hypothetical protein